MMIKHANDHYKISIHLSASARIHFYTFFILVNSYRNKERTIDLSTLSDGSKPSSTEEKYKNSLSCRLTSKFKLYRIKLQLLLNTKRKIKQSHGSRKYIDYLWLFRAKTMIVTLFY